jgi:L-asparaginase
MDAPSAMPTTYVITTGGTIEKEYSEEVSTVINRSSRIRAYIDLLRLPHSTVEVIALMNKDSLKITSEDRATLVAEVFKLARLGCPVVVTHGTDTMLESGLEIERALPGLSVPVILTGAMIPLGFEGSDGLQNLTESLFAARMLPSGVHVVLHGQALPVGQAQKVSARRTFIRKPASPAPA